MDTPPEEIPTVVSIDDAVTEVKHTESIRIGDYVGPEYKKILQKEVIDRKLAYAAKTQDEKFVVNFDGNESNKYEGLCRLSFGDGYFRNMLDKPIFVAKENGKQQLIHGDQLIAEYDKFNYIFEIDGKIGAMVQCNEDAMVFFDGKEGPKYKSVNLPSLIGDKLVYRAVNHDEKKILYVDGEELSSPDDSLFLAEVREKNISSKGAEINFQVLDFKNL